MGRKKKYIETFGSFTEPFNYEIGAYARHEITWQKTVH